MHVSRPNLVLPDLAHILDLTHFVVHVVSLVRRFVESRISVIGICEHARRGDNIFNTCFDRTTFTQLTNNLTLYPNITFKFPGVQVRFYTRPSSAMAPCRPCGGHRLTLPLAGSHHQVDLMPHQYLRTQLRSSYCVELAIAPIDNTLTILGDAFMRGTSPERTATQASPGFLRFGVETGFFLIWAIRPRDDL